MRKVGINAILNIAKNIMGMIFPLITYPYVSRILSVNNIGKVSYANSVVSYFLLFAMLGIQVYATREGAKLREDQKKINNFVSEIFTINIISSVLSLFILGVFLHYSRSFADYKLLIMIFACEIPLSLIGTDWINSIFENYFYIAVRTVLFQIIGLLMIFILVKCQEDYYKYAVCLVISTYGTGILNAFYTRKYCRKRLRISKESKKHIKPIVILFATSLASLVYSSADIMMLGIMTDDYHTGIYSTAAKVYNICKQILFAVIVVCLPRFSYILANRGKEQYQKLTCKIFKTILTIAVPLSIGILALSNEIICILSGPDFVAASTTLKIKSFSIFFAIIAYFFMQLVLLPNKKDLYIFEATLISGVFNLIANYFLIPVLYENGAAITTMLSELIVLFITYMASKKLISISLNVEFIRSIIIASIGMGLVLYCIYLLKMGVVLTLFLSFALGAVIYGLLLYIQRNEIILYIIGIVKQNDKML